MNITRCVMTLGAALVAALAAAAPAEAAIVHYATGWARPHVHYRAADRWTAAPGVPMADEGGGWWVADTGRAPLSELVFNDGGRRWDNAPGRKNYVAPAGAAEIWVRDGRVTLAPPDDLRLEVHDVPSRVLGRARRVRILLPAWYDRRPDARYPVLYLQDGQNLFDRNAFWGGWQVDACLAQATQAGGCAEMIVVGIDNADRMSEYTPVPDPGYGGGGADRYLDFLQRELKPWIDGKFRTRRDAASTAIGGSSLGGLISLYAGFKRPQTFGRVMAMSPSLWWADRWLPRELAGWRELPKIRVYVDSGSARDGAANVFALRDFLASRGFAFGSTLHHWYEASHEHNEAAWRARLPRALGRVFPR